MQRLRRSALLARLVLAWFSLWIGVAVAAPLAQPQSVELVCSSAGSVKLVLKGSDGAAGEAVAALDCPLCLTLDAPPLAFAPAVPAAPPIARQAPAAAMAVLVRPASAPPPARGPPRQKAA